jgi:hypothetical protein
MTIDKGQLFVVTRGFKHGKMFTQSHLTDSYDRGFEGQVFAAVEVCDTAVAAERIISSDSYHKVGEVVSINLLENEVMTVTREYVEALSTNEKENHAKATD